MSKTIFPALGASLIGALGLLYGATGAAAADRTPEAPEPAGNAIDDLKIWVHPADPGQSLLIGTNKKHGLFVYDLGGEALQSLPDENIDTMDLRQGFSFQESAEPATLVAASERASLGISLYQLDPKTHRLGRANADAIATGFAEPGGLCLYRSSRTHDFYVFANDGGSGAYKQWRLNSRDGRIAAQLVREFNVGSQTSGCTVDDYTGALYITEKSAGLWRYFAEPDVGNMRNPVDTVNGGHLTAGAESIAIYYGAGSAGYIVIANPGAKNYAVYRREDGNGFLGHFTVDSHQPSSTGTAADKEGLAVTSAMLGPSYPQGALLIMTGGAPDPQTGQNLMFVPWERIAETVADSKVYAPTAANLQRRRR